MIFTPHDAWSNQKSNQSESDGDNAQSRRASILRGPTVFNSKPINITADDCHSALKPGHLLKPDGPGPCAQPDHEKESTIDAENTYEIALTTGNRSYIKERREKSWTTVF
jgi:hypothetical protein